MMQFTAPNTISVVIPAKNESVSIKAVVTAVREQIPSGSEVIVVDDGSDDDTGPRARAAGARVLRHLYSRGNGAAIKSGAAAATGDVLVFLDADGQHDPGDIPRLLSEIRDGHDLVVGSRSRRSDQSSIGRWLANGAYNRLASLLVGHHVADLTSGFRAVRRSLFLPILPLLPNGFSYPTTSTMSFYRAGHSVRFLPITVRGRTAKEGSHIRPIRDGLRFLTIILKVVTLYSPLKVFAPASGLLLLSSAGWYGYTFLTQGRFTNMGMLLALSALLAFLFGLLSEQVTTLIHMQARQAADVPPTADEQS